MTYNSSDILIMGNFSFSSYEHFLSSFGRYYIVSILFIYAYVPIAFLGLVLNILSIFILNSSKKKFINQLYSYLRLIVFISILMNFLEIIFAIFRNRRFIMVGNNSSYQTIEAYLILPIYNTLIY